MFLFKVLKIIVGLILLPLLFVWILIDILVARNYNVSSKTAWAKRRFLCEKYFFFFFNSNNFIKYMNENGWTTTNNCSIIVNEQYGRRKLWKAFEKFDKTGEVKY